MRSRPVVSGQPSGRRAPNRAAPEAVPARPRRLCRPARGGCAGPPAEAVPAVRVSPGAGDASRPTGDPTRTRRAGPSRETGGAGPRDRRAPAGAAPRSGPVAASLPVRRGTAGTGRWDSEWAPAWCGPAREGATVPTRPCPARSAPARLPALRVASAGWAPPSLVPASGAGGPRGGWSTRPPGHQGHPSPTAPERHHQGHPGPPERGRHHQGHLGPPGPPGPGRQWGAASGATPDRGRCRSGGRPGPGPAPGGSRRLRARRPGPPPGEGRRPEEAASGRGRPRSRPRGAGARPGRRDRSRWDR